ncbi:MAG: Stk1 family PASTA domain-containing Ser/Thr kinase [Oscillospiraceae bacterium]|nr:Stk1 family PASTA domain-containing Ser/Thr kinase [Oscillospiraceae bacterium]
MIGKVLGNRYEILEKVGSGGMANVYKAKDRMLNRFVAVKVLHSEFKEDEEFIRRFNIESQAAASLSHQNIVQIYDVGEEEGIQYIVMEFLSGQTLKEYIKSKEGGLYRREALDYSMQICRALEHAHLKHIIHRDIKPQNIMITTEGILKVMDFGIARAANNNTTKMNSTAIGSAHYLSPEQARGGYTDQRSDIYSLGVVMYELFTGKLPFDADMPVAVAMKHIQEDPVPPSKLNPSVSKGIEQIILKAMSKEVRLRYTSAGEVLDDLKKLYLDPDALIADAPDTADEEEASEPKRRSTKTEEPPRRKKRRKTSSVVAIVASALAAVVFLALGLTLALSALTHSEEKKIVVPSLYGMTVEQAEDELKRLGEDYKDFSIRIEFYENNSAEKDTIISQTPAAEETVSGPREIKVVVSSGSGLVVLGNYRGESYTAIESYLTNNGIEVIRLEENSDKLPSGIIVRQEPESGTSVAAGESVTLYVSRGSANAVVPNVVGQTEAEARALIERSGLSVGKVIHDNNDSYVRGLVFDQGYAAYTQVPEGTKMDIFISDGSSGRSDEKGGDETGEASSSSAEENTQRPEVTDDPSDIQEMKTTYLGLSLPQDRTRVTIKLVCDGQVIYEKEHNTDTGRVSISLKSRGVKNVDIYFDDVLTETREVHFN